MDFINKTISDRHLVIEKEGKITGFTSAFIRKEFGTIAGASTIPQQLVEIVIREFCDFFSVQGIKEFYIRQLGDNRESVAIMKRLPLELKGEFVTLEKSL